MERERVEEEELEGRRRWEGIKREDIGRGSGRRRIEEGRKGKRKW